MSRRHRKISIKCVDSTVIGTQLSSRRYSTKRNRKRTLRISKNKKKSAKDKKSRKKPSSKMTKKVMHLPSEKRIGSMRNVLSARGADGSTKNSTVY